MSPTGTQAYEGLSGLPPLVWAAVGQARDVGFGLSCLRVHHVQLRDGSPGDHRKPVALGVA